MKNIMVISISNPTWGLDWYYLEEGERPWGPNLLFAIELPAHLPVGTKLTFNESGNSGDWFSNTPPDEPGWREMPGAEGEVAYIEHEHGHLVHVLSPVGVVDPHHGSSGAGPIHFFGQPYPEGEQDNLTIQRALVNNMEALGWTELHYTKGCAWDIDVEKRPFVS